jgi:hypothetical protein
MGILDRSLPPPLPAAELERLLISVEGQIAAEERRNQVTVAAAVAGAWLLELALAKKLHASPRAMGLAVLVMLIAAAVAGTHRLKLWAVGVAILTSAVFAVTMGTMPGLMPMIGVKCVLLELLASLVPWIAFLRTNAFVRRAEGAAVAAAGALAGHAALHLSCPVAHDDAHLLVFHLGGVLLAAALGGLAIPNRRIAPRAE